MAMARFFNRRLTALLIFGVILFIWWLFRTPTESDFSQSLVNENSDYPIMTPVVVPQDPNNAVFLLVIISTAPTGVSVERRQAIRSTWGKSDPNNDRKWHVVFMTGKSNNNATDKKLFQESKIHGDLFICDYKDQYDKILNKLLAAYNWAATVQQKYKFQYILKTDDDVYVNIPRLYRWIDNVGSQQKHLYAGVLYAGIVTRDKGHRHYVSEDQVPFSYWPPFCKGSMLVLSASLVPKIVKLSRKIQRIIPDDAYVGLIMNELKIKPVKLKGFVQQSLMPYFLMITDICVFQNVIGLGDSLSTKQVFNMHSIASLENRSIWPCVLWSRVSLVTVIIILLIGYFKGTRIKLWLGRRHIY